MLVGRLFLTMQSDLFRESMLIVASFNGLSLWPRLALQY